MLPGIFNAAQKTQLSPLVKPPATLACARELTLPSGISAANLLTMMGSAAELQATSTSSSYADVVNISSGKGVVEFCAFGADGAATQAEVTITIDGTTVVNAVATTGAGLRVPVGAVSNIDGTNFRASVALGAVAYNTSLRVQLRRSSGAATVSCFLKYRTA